MATVTVKLQFTVTVTITITITATVTVTVLTLNEYITSRFPELGTINHKHYGTSFYPM